MFLRYILMVALLLPLAATAQVHVQGVVTDSKKNPLFGANIYLPQNSTGISTNQNGEFTLHLPEGKPDTLIVSFVGYKTYKLPVSGHNHGLVIKLKESTELSEFTVEAKQQSTGIKLMEPLLTEEIGSHELRKAACCNIAESFETNATVDAVESDAVSGTKKIRMLGLDGNYTQFIVENVPVFRGLSQPTGLSNLPGTWVESIAITKGVGSVSLGHESMSGQINLQLKHPDDEDEPTGFVNLYGSVMGRAEANVHWKQKVSEKWSTLTFAHYSSTNRQNDQNNDNFLDVPLRETVTIFNRWKYEGKNFMSQIGLRAFKETIQGGSLTDVDVPYVFKGDDQYGEFFTKSGYIFKKEGRSLALITKGLLQDYSRKYGGLAIQAKQEQLIGKLLYTDVFGTHSFNSGINGILDNTIQSANKTDFSRKEREVGAFVEHTYKAKKNDWFTSVLGARVDYHNLFGTLFSPRWHTKIVLKNEWALRTTIGRGWRTPNQLVDQPGYFVSSRNVIFTNNLKPEISWNTGASISKAGKIAGKEFTFSADYFYTYFENSLVVDAENPRLLLFYNLDGPNFAHSFQTDFNIEPIKRFDVRLAYRYNFAVQTYVGVSKQMPLLPIHRGLVDFNWVDKKEIWQISASANGYAGARVQSTAANSIENQRAEKASPYAIINAQVSKKFRWFELYVGGENLLKYQQPNAIIDATNPFGNEFDASLIWGTTRGRNFYGGIRITIN